MISKDELLEIGELSMLEIGEEDLESYREEISQRLELLNKIKEVDTENVEITYNVNKMKNPLREDRVGESLPRKEVLKNTVEDQYGYFKILKVMD